VLLLPIGLQFMFCCVIFAKCLLLSFEVCNGVILMFSNLNKIHHNIYTTVVSYEASFSSAHMVKRITIIPIALQPRKSCGGPAIGWQAGAAACQQCADRPPRDLHV